MPDDEFLEEASEALEMLEHVDVNSYSGKAIPSPEDDLISHIVDSYAKATPLQREILRTAEYKQEAIAIATLNVLATYAIRMSMLCVRRRSEKILRRGIIATVMSMEWARSDPRDAGAYIVPMLAHSAKMLGADIEQVFREGRELASDPFTKVAIMPPERHKRGNILDSIGWAESQGPAGIVYHRVGDPIPEGWLVPERANGRG